MVVDSAAVLARHRLPASSSRPLVLVPVSSRLLTTTYFSQKEIMEQADAPKPLSVTSKVISIEVLTLIYEVFSPHGDCRARGVHSLQLL